MIGPPAADRIIFHTSLFGILCTTFATGLASTVELAAETV
jgi:hypothetical protein